MRELRVAKSAGFCFGVSRSVKMAEEMLAAEANCYSLGELIHNDDVVQHLRSEGLTVADGPEQIPQGASVAKFAELLGVQPNDVIKRLFMLGQVLTLTQSMPDDLIEPVLRTALYL